MVNKFLESSFADEDFTLQKPPNNKLTKHNTLLKIKPVVPNLSDFLVPCNVSDVFGLLAVPPKRHLLSELLAWFHFNNCSNDLTLHQKSKDCFLFFPLQLILL